jgi:pimeloyl-ACP methyl ester carboxylesterase
MKIRGNGVDLNVVDSGVDAGDETPVLLLHGWPDSHRLWRNQVPALNARGFRTIAPDMRGYGDSDRPEGVDNYALLNVLEDVRLILDALEIDRVHLVGHDWGAATSWAFASFYRDRVASLVALSVGHPAALQSAGYEQYARSWYMFMFQFEDVAEQWLSRNDWQFLRETMGRGGDLDDYIADLSRPGALTAGLNWYRANIPPASWISEPPQWPPIEVPTMGLWSTYDIALTETQMTGSQKFVTGPWRYERIEEVGHWIPLQAPDHLNELLLDFLTHQAS